MVKLVDDARERKCREGQEARERPHKVARRATVELLGDQSSTEVPDARVVKLVDTQDLKSCAGNSVPVQVRPRAPFLTSYLSNIS